MIGSSRSNVKDTKVSMDAIQPVNSNISNRYRDRFKIWIHESNGNKYVRTTRRSSRYHLVDQKDENYRVNNLWFKGDFNRGDDYGLLKEGNTYKVKGYGIRVPVLNMYKNIYNEEFK